MIKKKFQFNFFADLLQLPSSVSVSMKIPKFKKLRQWSHDSIVNLSQLTIRPTNNANNTTKQKQNFENPLPTTGITTISSAIREQKIDPKKDNFGLYALKCDRSRSLANARRGILLNLPSSKIKLAAAKVDTNNFQSVERNHEIFKSCEILTDNDGNSNMNENPKAKVEPPPRKKKKLLAPHLSALHHKPKQMVYQQVTKAGIQSTTTISMDSLEKNDSGLYRIVGSTETARITYVEPKKRDGIVAVVKPKVEKAITVKSTPMPRQITKVKNYEMNKANQQRRASQGSLKKVEVKKYTKSQSFESSATKSASDAIDIFKSNRIMDQKNLFDEFDELFEKNKAWEEKKDSKEVTNQSPAIAFEKLRELRRQSLSTFSIDGENEGVAKTDEIIKGNDNRQKIYDKNLARVKYVNSLLQEEEEEEEEKEEAVNNEIGEQSTKSLKPKIISEQKKQHIEINKKKILYYDDENELQDMIMKQQSQTKSSTKLLTMDVNVKDCDTQEMENSKTSSSSSSVSENKHPTQLISTNTTKSFSSSNSSNSLRIFSNDGDKIFVFNL